MKNIKKISALLLGTTFMLGSAVFASTGTVTTNGLRMRKEASTDSDIVTSLNNGAQVEIVEKVGEWYKVKYYDEYEGYLFGEYVKVEGEEETTDAEEKKPEENVVALPTGDPEPTEEQPAQEQPVQNEEPVISEPTGITYPIETTTKANTKIYIIPVITSTSINEIGADVKITVQKELNNWAYIQTETVSGWVRKYNINIEETVGALFTSDTQTTVEEKPEEQKPVEEKPETQKPEEDEPEQTTNEQEAKISKGYVNVSAARIRKEPTTDSDILEVLTLNTEVKVTAETDEWYKIQFNDITGYISKTLISENVTQTSRSNSTRQPETEQKQEERVGELLTGDQQTTEEESVQNDEKTSEKPKQVEEEVETKQEASTADKNVVSFAKQYLGYRYVYGGTTPSGGFDCSGFTYYVFNSCGYSLSRSCSVQAKSGRAITKAELEEGDLVFFDNTSDGSIGHVGIYVGNGNFIHAANPTRGVVIDTLESGYYYTYYYSARRIF